MPKYFSMEQTDTSADIYIFGDITSWEIVESDISSWTLSRQLQELSAVQNINVHVNSYGGEVAEGVAIYNMLRNHPAQVTTICEGFACSIASVIFMAGDVRKMNESSLLMIHNAWTCAFGANSDDLRKLAEDLEIMNDLSKKAYLAGSSVSEEKITELMDAETFISSADAYTMGFATELIPNTKPVLAAQSALASISQRLTKTGQLASVELSFDSSQITEMLEPLTKQLQELEEKLNSLETDDEPPDETPEEKKELPTEEPNQRLLSFLQAISQKGN